MEQRYLGNSGDTFNLASGATAGFEKFYRLFQILMQVVKLQPHQAMTDAISQAITPAATSSKVLVLLSFNFILRPMHMGSVVEY